VSQKYTDVPENILIKQLLLLKSENPTKGNQCSLANGEHAKPNFVRYELLQPSNITDLRPSHSIYKGF
jgi:hypothetical protein